MISLELSQDAPVDQTKLFLMKGRSANICHHCLKSVSRKSLLRCEHCSHDFCQGCLQACRCQSTPPFRLTLNFWKRRPAAVAARKLALVR